MIPDKTLEQELLDTIRRDSMHPECKGINRLNACRILRERYGLSLAQANELTRYLYDKVYNEKFPNKVNK